MELTFIGAAQVLIGLALLLGGTVEAMFAFLLVSGLFGGSAALALPLLGGSSIPPVQFALVFMGLRLLVPGAGQMGPLSRASAANLWLVAYVVTGVVLAMIAPRLFAGQVQVTPLRGLTAARYASQAAYIYATRPLAFSPQNLTTAIYLTGTLMAAIAAHVACQQERGRRVLVRTMAIVGLAHAALGFASVLGKGTVVETALAVFRNGSYAQLDHSWRGFVRMAGIWPEASSFSTYGLVWFVLAFECWLRRIDPRWTGPAALALAAALVTSTSSTAYVGLPAYAAVVLLRGLLFPGTLAADRVLLMLLAGLVLVTTGSALLIWKPVLANDLAELFRHFTIDKGTSVSGVQRRFWAWQGVEAFLASGGIGIGPGSFRSSSLATAVLGSTGVVGSVALIAHILHAFKPLRNSTWAAAAEPRWATGASAAWAMAMGLVVASISFPSCDPGTDFAVLSGAALALRGHRRGSASVRPPAPLDLRQWLATTGSPSFPPLDSVAAAIPAKGAG